MDLGLVKKNFLESTKKISIIGYYPELMNVYEIQVGKQNLPILGNFRCSILKMLVTFRHLFEFWHRGRSIHAM